MADEKDQKPWTPRRLRKLLNKAHRNLQSDDLIRMIGEREIVARLALDMLDRVEALAAHYEFGDAVYNGGGLVPVDRIREALVFPPGAVS